ncbi:hypothetical protein ES332_D11G009100v1 [Gossypium tomentosum]|uniref:Sulfotransferase n=1 Tax=Gossypium tomentosum TaxID=34277 RepID=A0A5D2IHR0_GOSTO|nr:hypothetical protein ES332_D11G009100v1 [Gossypium tomentosum]
MGQLPKVTWFRLDLYNWEGFWYVGDHLPGAMDAKSNFQAKDDDVLLTSSVKTGTTWLKAIIPTIMNPKGRKDDGSDDPSLKHHPNELTPSLELGFYKVNLNPVGTHTQHPDLSHMPSPRLFRTHIPYTSLSESVKTSACKIVYITRESRDPKDTFVSSWHFVNAFIGDQGIDPWPFKNAYGSFCNGVHAAGPFHDHVLGSWRESIKRPEMIYFMRNEDMKKDPKGEVKKLACFLGRPFEKEEEVEKVLWRRGIVGDWKNHFTDEMKGKLDQLTAMKFEGSGLDFGY